MTLWISSSLSSLPLPTLLLLSFATFNSKIGGGGGKYGGGQLRILTCTAAAAAATATAAAGATDNEGSCDADYNGGSESSQCTTSSGHYSKPMTTSSPSMIKYDIDGRVLRPKPPPRRFGVVQQNTNKGGGRGGLGRATKIEGKHTGRRSSPDKKDDEPPLFSSDKADSAANFENDVIQPNVTFRPPTKKCGKVSSGWWDGTWEHVYSHPEAPDVSKCCNLCMQNDNCEFFNLQLTGRKECHLMSAKGYFHADSHHQTSDIEAIPIITLTTTMTSASSSTSTTTTSSSSSKFSVNFDVELEDYNPRNPGGNGAWNGKDGVPYLYLAHVFESLSSTTKRLKKMRILTNIMRTALLLSPDQLADIFYLCTNDLSPAYEGVNLSIGGSTISWAVMESSGCTRSHMREMYKKLGDLGDVALSCRAKLRTMFKVKPLTIKGVRQELLAIAHESGQGSQKRKKKRILSLLTRCRSVETRWVVRTLCLHLRTGATRTSCLAALAQAKVLHDFQTALSSSSSSKSTMLSSTTGGTTSGLLHRLVASKEEEEEENNQKKKKKKKKKKNMGGNNLLLRNRGNSSGNSANYGDNDKRNNGGVIADVEASSSSSPSSYSSSSLHLKTLCCLKDIKQDIKTAQKMVADAYNRRPDLGKIIEVLTQKGGVGIDAVLSICVTPGLPVCCMLANTTRSIDQILELQSGKMTVAQYKYDGQRAQIHMLPNGRIKVFSRHNEDITMRYPDAIKAVREALRPDDNNNDDNDNDNNDNSNNDDERQLQKHHARKNIDDDSNVEERRPVATDDNQHPSTRSFILDAEICGYNREEKKLLSFQELSTRAKKNSSEEEQKRVPVCIFVFDLMYANDMPYTHLPFSSRRKQIGEMFSVIPGKFETAHEKSCRNTDEMKEFLACALEAGTEGLVVKVLDSVYTPGKRNNDWLKLKPDYSDTMGDSIDVVPIGAWWGNGRKVP